MQLSSASPTRWHTLMFASTALIAACSSDNISTPVRAPDFGVYQALVSEGIPEASARQADLARLVALSLRDASVRQRLKRDLRDSPQREFKVELRRYLRGSPLLDQMSRNGGRGRAAVDNALQALPAFELYMPVEQHRQTWTGTDDIIVVSTMDDAETPIGWDVRGQRVRLSRDVPPTRPVLSIVPVETDFGATLTPAQVAARGSASRETIQSPNVSLTTKDFALCKVECTDDGIITGSLPQGLYITFQRLEDDGEPWWMGAPEIEVHIHGPTAGSPTNYGADLACSGDRVSAPRGFNQDNASWSGTALLFTKAQIEQYLAIQPEGFHVAVWEDDNTVCALKLDGTALLTRITAIGTAVGGWTAVTAATTPVGTILAASTFIAGLWESLTMPTADDFLGIYIDANAAGYTFGDATHALFKNGGELNGRAKLVLR